jgi:hypothetical protein
MTTTATATGITTTIDTSKAKHPRFSGPGVCFFAHSNQAPGLLLHRRPLRHARSHPRAGHHHPAHRNPVHRPGVPDDRAIYHRRRSTNPRPHTPSNVDIGDGTVSQTAGGDAAPTCFFAESHCGGE